MGRALKLYQILSAFSGLARARSLRVPERSQAEFPATDSEKALAGIGVDGGIIEVMPWVLRPSEKPSDFVHTIIPGGATPVLRSGTMQNLSMAIRADTGHAQKKPKTAILLVGLMRDWELNLEAILSGMVRPNSAHIFIHTSDVINHILVKQLGSSLKRYVGNIPEHSLHHGWNNQFFNFEEAFKLMGDYERSNGFKYDVVVRARSDVAPAPPAWLNLEEWRDEGRIHMMTDLIFWGRRDDMAKIANTYSDVKLYYDRHPDPWRRPIAVASLLDSFPRDPFVHRKGNGSWTLHQKLQTLPYPDMGEEGALANLKKAMEKGMEYVTFEGHNTCTVSHGDVYTPNDYLNNSLNCEKDLLHWVLVHNLTICDIGSSMNRVQFSSRCPYHEYCQVLCKAESQDCINILSRGLASDCRLKSL
jgi:hypothetical protein